MDQRLQRILALLAVITPALIYIALRLKVGFDYSHPDECIPVQVISRILKTGSFDTNWLLAENLTGIPPIDQYNFSSYIVFSALLLKILLTVGKPFGLEATPDLILDALRIFSSLWQVAVIFLVYVVGTTLFKSRLTGVIAAWSVLLYPLLFQDSLYARPESFSSMLVLIMLILAGIRSENPSKPYFLFFGIVLGWLIACKVTFILLLFLPLATICSIPKNNRPYPLGLLLIVIAGIVVGFTIGAPFAIMNLGKYYAGLQELFAQYSGTQPPYGSPSPELGDRLIYAWRYLSVTGIALPVLVALGGGLILFKEKRYFLTSTFLLFVSVMVYFSSKPVFFERNFSFSLPVIALYSGATLTYLANRWAKGNKAWLFLPPITLFMLSGSILFMWQIHSKVLSGEYQQRRTMIQNKFVYSYSKPVIIMPWMVGNTSFQQFADFSRNDPLAIYEIPAANDEYTQKFLNEARTRLGMDAIVKLTSPFSEVGLPPTTLYTYHAPDYFYIARLAERFR